MHFSIEIWLIQPTYISFVLLPALNLLCHLLGSQKMIRSVLIDETFLLVTIYHFVRAIKCLPGWVCASADRIASDCLHQTKRLVICYILLKKFQIYVLFLFHKKSTIGNLSSTRNVSKHK